MSEHELSHLSQMLVYIAGNKVRVMTPFNVSHVSK